MKKHGFILISLSLSLATACSKTDAAKSDAPAATSATATTVAAKSDKAQTKPAVLPAKPAKPLVETLPEKFTKKGIKFTQQDDTEKRKGKFSENNQAAITSITKFKFPDTSIQLIVVTLKDASRMQYVDIDLLKLSGELQKADAAYTTNGIAVGAQNDTTRMLLIHKTEDEKLSTKIAWALR